MTVWERPVPRISDKYSECVAYLYRSKEAAKASNSEGGTGFFVSMPSDWAGSGAEPHSYLVTNRHVVDGAGGVLYAKLNLAHCTDCVPLSGWEPHEDPAVDLAICPIEVPEWVHGRHIEAQMFLTEAEIGPKLHGINVGVGDETFMLGRFVHHDGRVTNMPAAWFGNISMMPNEAIRIAGQEYKAYLVEMRSTYGSSGSPVFVFCPPWANEDVPGRETMDAMAGPWLLGVQARYFPTLCPVYDADGQPWPARIAASSGMSVVIPVERLRELLNKGIFVEARKKKDKETEIRRKVEQTPLPQSNTGKAATHEDIKKMSGAKDVYQTAKSMLDDVARRTEGRPPA